MLYYVFHLILLDNCNRTVDPGTETESIQVQTSLFTLSLAVHCIPGCIFHFEAQPPYYLLPCLDSTTLAKNTPTW